MKVTIDEITLKDIEIELELAELNDLPPNVRKLVLEHIANEVDIEILKQKMDQIRDMPFVPAPAPAEPKARKKPAWTEEQRAAAAECMRQLHANKKAGEQ